MIAISHNRLRAAAVEAYLERPGDVEVRTIHVDGVRYRVRPTLLFTSQAVDLAVFDDAARRVMMFTIEAV